MMPPFPEPLVTVFLFVLGLVLGSFLNVCIYRLPRDESLVRPGSRCPACHAPIRWYQNVPVVSWLVLGGRCASCRAPISWRYPLVELLAGGALACLWLAYGPSPRFLLAALFALPMIVLFFTDLDHQLLPDLVTLPGFAAGIAVAWFNPFLGFQPAWGRIWLALSGSALGAGVLWGIGALYTRLRGVEAMGRGDVKLMAMVGAFTGPVGVLFTLFAGSLVGAIVGVALIPLRGRTLRDTLPFGCFLAPAAVAALLFGQRAVSAWLEIVVPGP